MNNSSKVALPRSAPPGVFRSIVIIYIIDLLKINELRLIQKIFRRNLDDASKTERRDGRSDAVASDYIVSLFDHVMIRRQGSCPGSVYFFVSPDELKFV